MKILFFYSRKFQYSKNLHWASQVALVVKNTPANSGDSSSIPGLGRTPGIGNGYPLQYSCPENPTDRGAWWAILHGVSESAQPLSTAQKSTHQIALD